MSIKVKVGQSSKIRIVAAAEKKPLITPDSITLGIDTVGQYVAKIDAGSGIIVTPELNLENANLVISHAATSTEISSNNAGLVFAGNIDIDQYGHITQFNNSSLSSTNFSYSNTVISTNDITLGTTALTAGETSNTIVGLTSFEAGGVELFNRTFTANGDISFEPGSNNVIDMGFSRITGVSSPTDGFDAVNKTYLAFELERVENTVKVITDPILDSDATNKRYVDNLVTGFVVRPQALAATTTDLSAAFEEGNTSVRDTLTIPPVNFLYIDENADWNKTLAVIIDAKTAKISACNALDKILVNKNIPNFENKLKELETVLKEKTVKILVDNEIQKVLKQASLITEEATWREEFLALKCCIGAVDHLDEAIRMINTHSGGHSAAIMTTNDANADSFMQQVDCAAVYKNASTRFTDGGQLGVGAELAISTDKLHHRGPLGLKKLVTNKYYIFGEGQTRN